MTNQVHSINDLHDGVDARHTALSSTLIDDLMPVWSLREVDRVAVAGDESRVFKRARGFDLGRFALVHGLFVLRDMPARMLGQSTGHFASRLEDIVRPGSGFSLLGELPQREVVVGSIGTFWTPKIHFAEMTSASFARFIEPGYGKLAWSLRVEPRAYGSWLVFELRVDATNQESWKRFQRYWRLIGPFSRLIRRIVLRELERDLGSYREREHTVSRRRGLGAMR